MHFIVNNIGKIAIALLLSILLYLSNGISYLKDQNEVRGYQIHALNLKNNEVIGKINKVDTSRKENELILLKDLTLINMQLLDLENTLILQKTIIHKEIRYNRRLAKKLAECRKRCE